MLQVRGRCRHALAAAKPAGTPSAGTTQAAAVIRANVYAASNYRAPKSGGLHSTIASWKLKAAVQRLLMSIHDIHHGNRSKELRDACKCDSLASESQYVTA